MTKNGELGPVAIHVCGMCRSWSKHIRPVVINGVTVVVGRCTECDTTPCKKCEGRTIDPFATACKHCGHKIGLKV